MIDNKCFNTPPLSLILLEVHLFFARISQCGCLKLCRVTYVQAGGCICFLSYLTFIWMLCYYCMEQHAI